MWLSKEMIELRVDDARRAAAFYEALLDAPPTHRSAQSAVFDLASPPLVLTLQERPRGGRSKTRRDNDSKPGGAVYETPPALRAGARLALVLREPRQIGDVVIRLRRAGARLWIQDQGIEAHDPDGNAWRVRCVPATPGRAIVTNLVDAKGSERR